MNEFAERKDLVRSAPAPMQHTAMRQLASHISRMNYARGKSELLNEALSVAVDLCYEVDDAGLHCNVDTRTGRILIPVPWGHKGRKHFDVRRTEADVLRFVLHQYAKSKRPPPLFFFVGNSWYLNGKDYRSREDALGYLAKCEIHPREWVEVSRTLSQQGIH